MYLPTLWAVIHYLALRTEADPIVCLRTPYFFGPDLESQHLLQMRNVHTFPTENVWSAILTVVRFDVAVGRLHTAHIGHSNPVSGGTATVIQPGFSFQGRGRPTA